MTKKQLDNTPKNMDRDSFEDFMLFISYTKDYYPVNRNEQAHYIADKWGILPHYKAIFEILMLLQYGVRRNSIESFYRMLDKYSEKFVTSFS